MPAEEAKAAHWPAKLVAQHPVGFDMCLALQLKSSASFWRTRKPSRPELHVMALSSKSGAGLQSPTATFRETECSSNPFFTETRHARHCLRMQGRNRSRRQGQDGRRVHERNQGDHPFAARLDKRRIP